MNPKKVLLDHLLERCICPISTEIFKDPVVACDGHTYERQYIEDWLKIKKISPVSNIPMNDTLVPNYSLRSLIEEMLSLCNDEFDDNAINSDLSRWLRSIGLKNSKSLLEVMGILNQNKINTCEELCKHVSMIRDIVGINDQEKDLILRNISALQDSFRTDKDRVENMDKKISFLAEALVLLSKSSNVSTSAGTNIAEKLKSILPGVKSSDIGGKEPSFVSNPPTKPSRGSEGSSSRSIPPPSSVAQPTALPPPPPSPTTVSVVQPCFIDVSNIRNWVVEGDRVTCDQGPSIIYSNKVVSARSAPIMWKFAVMGNSSWCLITVPKSKLGDHAGFIHSEGVGLASVNLLGTRLTKVQLHNKPIEAVLYPDKLSIKYGGDLYLQNYEIGNEEYHLVICGFKGTTVKFQM